MEYRFTPRGVCSREMVIELNGDIIKSVKILKNVIIILIVVKHF